MAEPEDNPNDRDDRSRSFWVTAPGFITAAGGFLTAIAVLIGALNASGVIGGTADSPSSPDTSVTPANRSDSDGVLHGDWLVNLEIRKVDGPGAVYTNKIWGLEPTVGASSQEHWELDSLCPESPCETRWDSIETPDRFATLQFENSTYTDNDTGNAACPGGSVPVQRSILLHVTHSDDVDGVWSGIAISGQIETSWTCGGQQVRGVLDVDGSRTLP